jgi:glucose/arabinose dehydrogenase
VIGSTRLTIALVACLGALASPAEAVQLKSVRIVQGLSSTVFVTAPPGDAQRLFIVEYVSGKIKIRKNGAVLPTPFIDLGPVVTDAGGEQGLLGLAFHPNYAANGFFYVYYIDNSGQAVLARYQVTSDPDVADPGSGQILLTQSQPTTVHKGGTLAFGPNDGYLYLGLGDGGGGSVAQMGNTFLGKMLRIDVDGGAPYAIPPDNPFVGAGDPLDEIWAKGFRNPYRWSFDRLTGDLYIGDVGQSQREEIDFQSAASPGGENYGWTFKEGTQCYQPPTNCDPGGLTEPIHDYDHADGRCSVTGGSVYRGCAMPELRGTYFFADFCTKQFWSFRQVGGVVTEFEERTAELNPGGNTLSSPVAIAEDGPGELHIVSLSGQIFKIVPETLIDCNTNGEADGCDIASGASNDVDQNGVPDECQSPAPQIPTLGPESLAVLSLLLAGAGARRLRARRR